MTFRVNKDELRITFARSGGPGGQNVNRRETKVTLRWRFGLSDSLSVAQKEILQRKLRNRINKDGELVLTCDDTRYQERNLETAVRMLGNMVCVALRPEPKRIPTRPPKSAAKKRLNEKRKQAHKKKLRMPVRENDA